jgi:hypothetical protein
MIKPEGNVDERGEGGKLAEETAEEICIANGESLFKTVVCFENPSRYCVVVLTRTHFAWRPSNSIIFMPYFSAGVYSAVSWSAVSHVEFDHSEDVHEKVIRVILSTDGPGRFGRVEMTGIGSFDRWVREFRKVGFSPAADNPFRITTLRGFLCNFGGMLWIALIAMLGFALFTIDIRAVLLLPVIVPLIGLPLWLWSWRVARKWFPPGKGVVLQRRERIYW